MIPAAQDPFEHILACAEGVKRLGPDRAIFKSPTRVDKTPSVSICRAANGSVLLNDFGGASATDILSAFGLTLSALFPARERRDMTPAERETLRQHARVAQWSAALAMMDFEVCVVLIVAGDVAAGKTPDPEDIERLQLAAKRISDARGILCPQPKFRPLVAS